MVNQICRMDPGPLMFASVTVEFALTSTQSALPPDRSALEARLEIASLRFARLSRGPLCCPKQGNSQPRLSAVQSMMLIPIRGIRKSITVATCSAVTPCPEADRVHGDRVSMVCLRATLQYAASFYALPPA